MNPDQITACLVKGCKRRATASMQFDPCPRRKTLGTRDRALGVEEDDGFVLGFEQQSAALEGDAE